MILFTENQAQIVVDKYLPIIKAKFPIDTVDVGMETKSEYGGKFRVYVQAPYSKQMEDIESYCKTIAIPFSTDQPV